MMGSEEMVEEYKKVVYVWNEPKPKIEVPNRLRFRAINEDSMDI